MTTAMMKKNKTVSLQFQKRLGHLRETTRLPLQNLPRKNEPNLILPPFYDKKIFVAIEMRLENLNPVSCLLTRLPSPSFRNGDGLRLVGKKTHVWANFIWCFWEFMLVSGSMLDFFNYFVLIFTLPEANIFQPGNGWLDHFLVSFWGR